MGDCSDGTCSSGSCGGNCSGKDKDGLPPGMLSKYDLNMDTGTGTLVFIEISGCGIADGTARLLSKIREINDDRIFGALFVPTGADEICSEAFSRGVDTVYRVKCDDDTDVESVSETLKDICERVNPMAVCFSGTKKGNIIAEKTAFIMGKPLMRDGTEITMDNGAYKSDALTDFVPMFSKRNRFPIIMTFKPDAFPPSKAHREGTGTVINRMLMKKS